MKNYKFINKFKHEGVYVSKFKEKANMKVYSAWKLPANFNESGLTKAEIARIKKANKYLSYMNRKLLEYSRDGNTHRVAILGDILMRRSAAFQTMVLNKSEKKGVYDISLDRVLKILNTSLRGIRKKKEDLNFHRFYIQKANGKGRPIGEPDQPSKYVLTAIERIVRLILEPKIGDYQHGFVTGRSSQTAGYRIIEEYRKGNNRAHEFDLKSFFNMINVQMIASRLNSIAKGLGNWVKASTFNTHPKFEEYKEEAEIEEMTIGTTKVYRKRGFTQGSPIAPLMSIGALEFADFNKIPGLIMYADDGVIMSKNGEGLSEYLGQKARMAGIYIAEDKSNGETRQLEFLGLVLNLETAELWIKNKPGTKVSIKRDSKQLDEVLSYARYGTEVKKKWIGNVYPGSIQGHRRLEDRLYSPLNVKIYSLTMKVLGAICPSKLEPTHKIGKFLQKGGEELVSGKPQSATTYGSAKVLEFLKESSNKSRKDIRITEYQISEAGDSGTDFAISDNKIFIRYPHNGGTLGYEDERIANLIPTNFYKLIKIDA